MTQRTFTDWLDEQTFDLIDRQGDPVLMWKLVEAANAFEAATKCQTCGRTSGHDWWCK